MNPYTTWEQVHPGDTHGEALCDSWNSVNAIEMSDFPLRSLKVNGKVFRVLNQHRCAISLRTPDWVPPSEVMTCQHWHDPEKLRVRYLGGDKISCGAPIRADEFSGDMSEVRHYGLNVCRPFDEAWDESRTPERDRHPLAAKRTRDDFPYATNFKDGNANVRRITPPNHGHGAKCECVVDGVPLDHPLATNPICPHCAGTGRIICDQDSMGGIRAGRVSPSHAAGGYAEWRRNYPETPETIHGFPVSGQSTSNVSELDEESQEAYERAMERD